MYSDDTNSHLPKDGLTVGIRGSKCMIDIDYPGRYRINELQPFSLQKTPMSRVGLPSVYRSG